MDKVVNGFTKEKLFELALQSAILGPVSYGTGKPLKAATRVYRIEMENGFGPYNSHRPDAEEIYNTICDFKDGFACAMNAGLLREQMGMSERAFYDAHGDASYACESLEALNDWFHEPARRYLKGKGAKVVVYEVPAGAPLLRTGKGEVIFAKPTARKVDMLDVVTDKAN